MKVRNCSDHAISECTSNDLVEADLAILVTSANVLLDGTVDVTSISMLVNLHTLYLLFRFSKYVSLERASDSMSCFTVGRYIKSTWHLSCSFIGDGLRQYVGKYGLTLMDEV